MKIVPFQKEHYECIERIYNLSKADEFSGEESDISIIELANDKSNLELLEKSQIFVAIDSRVLGFVGFNENYISWLYVHPEYRHRKIGTELMNHIIPKIKDTKYLNVAASNRNACNMYSKLGFKVINTFTGKYNGTPVTVNKLAL